MVCHATSLDKLPNLPQLRKDMHIEEWLWQPFSFLPSAPDPSHAIVDWTKGEHQIQGQPNYCLVSSQWCGWKIIIFKMIYIRQPLSLSCSPGECELRHTAKMQLQVEIKAERKYRGKPRIWLRAITGGKKNRYWAQGMVEHCTGDHGPHCRVPGEAPDLDFPLLLVSVKPLLPISIAKFHE